MGRAREPEYTWTEAFDRSSLYQPADDAAGQPDIDRLLPAEDPVLGGREFTQRSPVLSLNHT